MFAGGARGAGLDAVVPVRRDGGDVVASSTTRPRRASPRLRRRPATASSSPAAAGMVVLEDLDRAIAPAARSIHAEITGFGATSRRVTTWWRPPARAASGRCGWRCGQLPEGRTRRLHQRARHLDPGRRRQARWRRCGNVFGDADGGGGTPPISVDEVDDRAQPGRGTGAQEAIYSPADAEQGRLHRARRSTSRRWIPAIRPGRDRDGAAGGRCRASTRMMTNSFGFGGTNGSMLLSRYSKDLTHERPPRRPARPRHGRRQRPLHRLGNREARWPPRGPSSPSPTRAPPSGSRVAAAGRKPRQPT